MDVPIWAEIDLGAIAHNLREIRRVTGPRAQIMAVVKANAYGHGAVEVARTVLSNGASCLAVARVSEGADLRRAGVDAPILLYGYTPPAQFPEVLRHKLIQTVYARSMAAQLSRVALEHGERAPVHIKVDTGMGRIGFASTGAAAGDAVDDIVAAAKLPGLEVAGIYTHFASADGSDKTYTREQFALFIKIIDLLRQRGLAVPLCHCANSPAIIDLPDTHLDMVRPGIILYGLYPSEEVDKSRIDLRPAMSFKTRVAHVKKVPAGCKISYGCTYETPSATVIATLSVGYADGYSRLLSSKGEVLIRGQRAPVVGRICMDQCMVDVGHIGDVSPGEEAVLFGTQAGASLPVEDVAASIGTINYEVVCMVGDRVPRVFK